METPDILNSKIKKLLIELPQYHFSHSSSGDSSHPFIGRERIRKKLKKIVEDSPAEPGVYLVAGNRGVGKTSLVNEVINETSLQPNFNFFKNLGHLFSSKDNKKKRKRLYLRINFGHKLKDEKDILRLITRTLITEYDKYNHSNGRLFIWRAIAFFFLFLLAFLFSYFTIIQPEFCYIIRRVAYSIYCLPRLLNFLTCLLYLSLFYVLLFRCTWVTNFFITHRIIMKRLKKLDSDITYSTERENSIGINNEKIGSRIGSKKTRNVADAREIEKELQDILNDMQRIPSFMCRPNVVIVFDELDKVEPGDTSSEKENSQTKSSLFSIGATRERQTEILRILANMKYFLSTAKAKFIFIAGREMYDIHLADVSERNNYIGSIFNVVIYVPSFLVDHPTGEKIFPEESSIAALPEEFVCRRLFPSNYTPKYSYNLKSYRYYLKNVIYKDITDDIQKEEMVQKIIAVLQQFIIYLAHLSKGAPKKMMQLFESFVTVRKIDENERENSLLVQSDNKSKHFLNFSYYKQYTIGIIAYLITPIFYRLSESNIKEHSDKLLVSTLRFVDFLFKFHKHSFSWKQLDISPEMLEPNRAPELKSVAVDLLNYLSRVHINKSNFNFYDYKFDSWIANEIFTMTKTDDVFSALFSFSLDETLPLKKHYRELLEKTEKEYQDDKTSAKYIDAISSLRIVLGDLHYYDDELEDAIVCYKDAVQMLNKEGDDEIKNIERLYLYVRNKLKLGMIHERRKQYDFAYLTYDDLCKRIGRKNIKEQNNTEPLPQDYAELKMLYLPFIAKFQIREKSHISGITSEHLDLMKNDFEKLIEKIKNKEDEKFLKAEFYSRVADILYYKNSSVEKLKACHNYRKALYTLLNESESDSNAIKELLSKSVERIKDKYNVKFYTILARILSDWGNVFFSRITEKKLPNNLEICVNYVESDNMNLAEIKIEEKDFAEISFAMYAISSVAYRKANLYKRSAYQIYKMLCLFKHYGIYKESKDYINKLSKKAIHYLWHANEDLNVFELNKREKDFGVDKIEDTMTLQYLLVDSGITKIRILVKEMELINDPKDLKEYYDMHVTSPYRINYSIGGRIYRLRLKSIVNNEMYQQLLEKAGIINVRNRKFVLEKKDYDNILNNKDCESTVRGIFGESFNIKEIFENLIAETIYCSIDIIQLSKTMGETYVFTHSFLGSIHEDLSFWIWQYEMYKKQNSVSKIEDILEKYLGEEWKELLSKYRGNQQAVAHYRKCLEMHSEGRAYHDMIDTMCYLKDDYNDRSDHFNIAEERYLILNEDYEKKIKDLEDLDFVKNSELHKIEKYFNKTQQ